MINIPEINNIALQIGPIKIYWYGLAYFFGILFGIFGIKILDKRYNYLNNNQKLFDQLIVYIVLGILLGGRLGYILFYNPSFYLDNLDEIIKVWHGGMSFHGAVIGLLVSIYYFSKKNNIKFCAIADYICFVAPIGIFFGRIANFINQELLGRETNSWIGVKFPHDSIARHASPIYESIGEGLFIFLIFLLLEIKYKILSKNGFIFGLFLILYGFIRFVIEFFRGPDEQIGFLLNYFTIGQFFCFGMIIAGFILIFRKLRFHC